VNGAAAAGGAAGGGVDRITGQPLSPRAFRAFGVEAVVLGRATQQAGLHRREGVAVWRRLPEHAGLFDRLAATAPRLGGATDGDDLAAVPVVVAVAPRRSRALRVPAVGARAEWALTAAERVRAGSDPAPDLGPDPGPGRAPAAGWLLLVDEGPGETWLYQGEGRGPAEVLDGFLGRRGRTDFGRARQRTRRGGLAGAGAFAGLVLAIYSSAIGLGSAGHVAGLVLLAASLAVLVAARPR
jgi:hypothetical protein